MQWLSYRSAGVGKVDGKWSVNIYYGALTAVRRAGGISRIDSRLDRLSSRVLPASRDGNFTGSDVQSSRRRRMRREKVDFGRTK